jgi:hypothetical protein
LGLLPRRERLFLGDVMSNYKLINKVPVRCDDIIEWSKWFGTFNSTVIKTQKEQLLISTVFLGMDHNFSNGSKGSNFDPILFETMVFDDSKTETDFTEQYCRRYSTWDQATKGHVEICKEYLTSYTEEDLFLDIL